MTLTSKILRISLVLAALGVAGAAGFFTGRNLGFDDGARAGFGLGRLVGQQEGAQAVLEQLQKPAPGRGI